MWALLLAVCSKITTEDEWDDILIKPEIVFARTSPQQKLQIVSRPPAADFKSAGLCL